MIVQPEYIAQLIKKLFDGSISESEKLELQNWIDENPKRKAFIEELNQNDQLFEEALIWIKLEHEDKDGWIERLSNTTFDKIDKLKQPRSINYKRIFKIIGSVAAVISIGFFLTYFIIRNNELKFIEQNQIALQNILPGKHQATLTLPSGEEIALSEQNDLIEIDNQQLIKYSNGEIISDLRNKFPENSTISVKVPRAGHYKIKLSEGSLIWVNSESELIIPIKFSHDRELALNGEAFFDVHTLYNNDLKIPFKVKSKGQLIEVTGTQFNVYAFPAEHIKTTLVEGKVNVYTPKTTISLNPNEQSYLSNSGLRKSQVDIGPEVAWKDNMFYFNETPLKTAMTQLSRWYDLEIQYRGDVPDTYFYGEFSRDQPLKDLLKILEEADVKFEFEARNNKNYLIVLP